VLADALVGSAVLGGFTVGSTSPLGSEPVPQPGYLGRRRGQMGWGYDYRTHCRAYAFSFPTQSSQVGAGSLTVTTLTGSVLGAIRTDTQFSPIGGVKYTRDRNGCADAVLTLCEPPRFEILPFAVVRYSLADVQAYEGVVTAPPEIPTTDDKALEYKIFGLRRWLEQLQPADGYGVFEAGTDVTEIVRSIAQNSLVGRSPIRYDAAKIDALSGTVIAADIDVTNKSLKSILNFLAGLAQTPEYYYVWKIDEEGALAWTRYDRDVPVKTFFVGYDIFDFKPQKNFDTIKNTISIHREAEPESGDSGFGVVGIFNDETSVKKYGRLELVQKVPGYVADADGVAYGEALLSDLAEPKFAATGKALLRSSADLLPEGAPVRVVMPFGVFRDELSPLDRAQVADEYTDEYDNVFEIEGAGDLAVSFDPDNFIYANGAVKLTFENAVGQVAVLRVESKIPVRRIFFYARATRIGAIVRVGVGKNAWNERTATISLKSAGEFYPFEIDFSDDPLFSGIGFFGVEILGDENAPQSVWLDKLDGEFVGNKTYKLILESATYDLSATTGEVALKFGQPAASIVDYVAALQVLVSDMQRTGQQT